MNFETHKRKKNLCWTPSQEQIDYLNEWLECGSEKNARRRLGLKPSQVAAWRGEEGSGFKVWVESQIADRAHNAIIMNLVANIGDAEKDKFSDPADRDKATKMMMAATKYLESRNKEQGEVKDFRDLSRKVTI